MITSNLGRAGHPSRVSISLASPDGQQSGLKLDSVIVTDNLATIHHNEIDRKLQADAARPILGWGKQHWAHWPHVKGLVPHNNVYNFSRFQDVWLDK